MQCDINLILGGDFGTHVLAEFSHVVFVFNTNDIGIHDVVKALCELFALQHDDTIEYDTMQ